MDPMRYLLIANGPLKVGGFWGRNAIGGFRFEKGLTEKRKREGMKNSAADGALP